jgi:small conductance mechanosensitive channel
MEAMLGMVREGAWTTIAAYWGGRILIALLVLFVGIRLAKWLTGLAEKGMARSHIEPTAVSFLRKVVYVALLVVLALTVLQAIFGVAPTSMIAVLGAAGLAIGLALKDSLSNVASGVMLVSLKPFRVGHIVTINGVTGKVEDVSIFQTRLRGADNQVIVMPNSLITTDSIINLTPDTMRRVEIVVGIGYGDDIDHARRVIEEIFAADDRLLADPPPDVMVYGLGDNSVNLGVRCHVANADWFAVKCALTEQIKKRFDAEGISIPYPQRDVHMYHHAGAGMPELSGSSGGRPALPGMPGTSEPQTG